MLTLRPIEESDQEFLRALYASTRAEEMAMVPWSEAEKQAFVEMQFEAQQGFYSEQFPQAHFDLVLEDGAPIGRLYVDRRADEHRVIDIALVPARRGRGLGSALMCQVLEEAAAAGKQVRIHVEKNNPALHLYERLGFEAVEDQGVYDLMEWRPQVGASAVGGGRS